MTSCPTSDPTVLHDIQTLYVSITVFDNYSTKFAVIYMATTHLCPSSDTLFQFMNISLLFQDCEWSD